MSQLLAHLGYLAETIATLGQQIEAHLDAKNRYGFAHICHDHPNSLQII